MIDLSTGSISPVKSRLQNVCPKIIGYLPSIECYPQKLIPLKKILPVSSKLLNFILINLISIILEIIKRDQPTPDLRIENIMVNQEDYTCGIPFIISKQDGTTARLCKVKLLRQFQFLCQQLGCDADLINRPSLNDLQEKLYLEISFQQDSLKENAEVLLNYLQIEDINISCSNDYTKLYLVQPPKFLSRTLQGEKIAMKVSEQNQEIYELREINIIEEFNNEHLPYLYGYLRYQNITILFLKKHDSTFDHIQSELFRKRSKISQDQIHQIVLNLYRQMVKAISFIHSIDIIHRDLKPENIMFDHQKSEESVIEILDKPLTCVLIDFDRSFMPENLTTQQKSNYKGTPFFRPPEGEQIRYNSSYDIWQLGFIWLVIQKQFYNMKNKAYEKIQNQQSQIQDINTLILKLQDEIQTLRERKINENEKQIQKIQLENRIKNYQDQKREQYSKLILDINEQENSFNYNNQLQNIIKKMIEFDPQQRASLNEVSAVLDSINQ